MNRQKKRAGRKRQASRMMIWGAILLVVNIVWNVVPLFPFQARKKMDAEWEWDRTHVIWEEENDFGRWDGNFHCLAVNEDVAVFYNTHWFFIYGWVTSVVRPLDKGTPAPFYAEWSGNYDRDYHDTVWAMGYVASKEIATLEYRFSWYDNTVETYRIPDTAYVWDGVDRYYVYDTGACLFHEDPDEPGHAWHIVDIVVTALDANGNVLYEECIYPSWKNDWLEP